MKALNTVLVFVALLVCLLLPPRQAQAQWTNYPTWYDNTPGSSYVEYTCTGYYASAWYIGNCNYNWTCTCNINNVYVAYYNGSTLLGTYNFAVSGDTTYPDNNPTSGVVNANYGQDISFTGSCYAIPPSPSTDWIEMVITEKPAGAATANVQFQCTVTTVITCAFDSSQETWTEGYSVTSQFTLR